MVSKKSSRVPASNISSAALPTKSPSTKTKGAHSSSILLSSFIPSSFQLRLFASVIQAFDSQHLRVHDPNSGRLQCEYKLPTGTQVSSLDWGYLGSSPSEQREDGSKKKRKREAINGVKGGNHAGNVVIALGTSAPNIQLFSYSQNKIIGTLSGGHDRGIRGFRFTDGTSEEGWSIGEDGRLIQWDVANRRVKRSLTLPDTAITVIARPVVQAPQILCSSSVPFAINFGDEEAQKIFKFDAFRQPVHSIVRSSRSEEISTAKFLAADRGRHMTVNNLEERKIVRTLIADSEVLSIDLFESSSRPLGGSHEGRGDALLVTTSDGVVELFYAPFDHPSTYSQNASSKKKNKTAKADASIRIIRPDSSGTIIPVICAAFYGSEIVLARAEGGLDLIFERSSWQDDTGSLLHGTREIVQTKSASTINSATMSGVKEVGKAYVDESCTIVFDNAANDEGHYDKEDGFPPHISEDDEEEEESSGNESIASEDRIPHSKSTEPSKTNLLINGSDVSDEEMEDADIAAQGGVEELEQNQNEDNNDDDDGEPTFGDMMHDRTVVDPISVTDALVAPDSTAMVTTAESGLQSMPSGVSLSTVLTQSLRTNDQALLESCFLNTDTSTIRLTIQRLDSSLAGLLFHKLTERLSRPGRYSQLLVWVQWICVAHGGVVAARPDCLEKIKSLNAALSKRSQALDSLLLLKGKLDMLDAQVGLRRSMAAQRSVSSGRPANEDDVIYIEGQEEESSSDEDEAAGGRPRIKGRNQKSLQELGEEEGSEDDEDMPMINGFGPGSEEDQEMVEDDEDDRLIDSEADVSEDAESDAPDVSEDEDEEDEDEEDSEINGFIDDGEISVEGSNDQLVDTPEKPPSKKHKRR